MFEVAYASQQLFVRYAKKKINSFMHHFKKWTEHV